MRDYGKIHVSFWASQTMSALDSDARLLAIYLITSQHTTMLGAFRLPDAYACEDLGWSAERFQNCLETLSAVGFIKYDKATKIVWIVKFTKWNKPDNPNQQKAIAKLGHALPADLLFKDEILAACGVSETVSKPLGNSPIPTPIPIPVVEQEILDAITLPLNDGSEYAVTEAELAVMQSAHPRVDVVGELRKARLWCIANPAKRKTRRGVMSFLAKWLGNAPVVASVAAVTAPQAPGGGRRAL